MVVIGILKPQSTIRRWSPGSRSQVVDFAVGIVAFSTTTDVRDPSRFGGSCWSSGQENRDVHLSTTTVCWSDNAVFCASNLQSTIQPNLRKFSILGEPRIIAKRVVLLDHRNPIPIPKFRMPLRFTLSQRAGGPEKGRDDDSDEGTAGHGNLFQPRPELVVGLVAKHAAECVCQCGFRLFSTGVDIVWGGKPDVTGTAHRVEIPTEATCLALPVYPISAGNARTFLNVWGLIEPSKKLALDNGVRVCSNSKHTYFASLATNQMLLDPDGPQEVSNDSIEGK